MRIVRIIIGVAGLLFTIALSILDILGIWPNYLKDWSILLGISIFSIAVVWHIVQLELDLNAKTPKIDISGKPFIDLIDFKDFSVIPPIEVKYLRNRARFAHVKFANNPRISTDENTARNVSAKITYQKPNGEEILEPIYGRWAEAENPSNVTLGNISNLIDIDIKSNGVPRTLDLAVKFCKQDKGFSAWGHKIYSTGDWLNKDYKITDSLVHVKVELNGVRVKLTRIFIIRSDEGIFEVDSLL